ncbi:MAG: NifU family protein [Bdellovibrionota bacterium]
MLQFRIQSTPNPFARKYIVSAELKREGKVSYKDPEDCRHVPLAVALLSIPAVSQVHFFENVVTITQDGTMDWARVDHAVQAILNEKINAHDPDFIESLEISQEEKRAMMTPEMQRIDEILDHTIRPALQADGGDLELIDYDGLVLSVRYMGACGDCPSSMMGTLAAITGVLQDQFRPDIEVVVI